MIKLGERAWSLLKLRRLQQRKSEGAQRRAWTRRAGSCTLLARQLTLVTALSFLSMLAAAAEREFTLDNGDYYKGTVVDGFRTGSGLYIWADKRQYEGEFDDRRAVFFPNKRGQKGAYVLDAAGHGPNTRLRSITVVSICVSDVAPIS